jgi:hypothetical protein
MGRAGQHVFLDRPDSRVTGVYLTQILPFFDHKAIGLFRDYETAVYQMLA